MAQVNKPVGYGFDEDGSVVIDAKDFIAWLKQVRKKIPKVHMDAVNKAIKEAIESGADINIREAKESAKPVIAQCQGTLDVAIRALENLLLEAENARPELD